MEGLGQAPARTEADLRAAFAELARRAPGADDVLSAVREAGPGRPRRVRPVRPVRWGWVPGRRFGWPQTALGAAAVVTATAVTLAVTLGGSPGRTGSQVALPALPNPPASAGGAPAVVSPGGHPSAGSLAKAMLTAFNAAGDDLAYESVADFRAGHLFQLARTWSWPAVPSTGQVQYNRDESSVIPPGESQLAGTVKLTEDDGYTTVVPHPSPYEQKEPARLIVVCYAGTGQTSCGWNSYNTRAGTWSEHTGFMPYIDYTPMPRGAGLARQIAAGHWRIVGHTQLGGQRAIKLVQTHSGATLQGNPVYLWVSTATWLPLRLTSVVGKVTETDNWSYLKPSKANLANLRVPIPAGYPRSG